MSTAPIQTQSISVHTHLEQDLPDSQLEVQAPSRQCVAMQCLVKDTLNAIGAYLDVSVLGNLRLTCRQWADWTGADDEINALAQRRNVLRSLVMHCGFGAGDWEKYFGTVTYVPLPLELLDILRGPCPIWPDRMIKDTHMLVLIPEIVNANPLTLDYLERLIQHPQGGRKATQCRGYWDNVKAQHGSTPAPKSHWVLVTRDVLEKTKGKIYSDQQAFVARYPGYEVPRVLPTATAILMEHVKTGKRLYTDSPWTYTRCQESTDGYQLVVGGFTLDGPGIHCDDWTVIPAGLAALRKL